MPNACRELIVAAVATILTGMTLVPPPKVERNRREPLDDNDLPSLILFEGQEIPLNDFSSEDAYRLSLLVQCAIKGSPGQPAAAATAANNTRAAVIKALMADISLGGRARNLEIVDAGDWIGTPTSSDDTEGFILQADITYATVEGDPFNFSP